MTSLSGPRLEPLQGPATHLVVLVHGYGSDGNDLISLAAHWQPLLPTVAFVAPDAPTRVPGAPSGYQWFPISRIDPHEMLKGVEAAAPVLDAFLDAELATRGLGPERLALVGFSQGTMLSLHLGLRRAVPPAAILGFSGLLPGPPPSKAGQNSWPPVFLAHGSADQVIPVGAMLAAAGTLGVVGAAVQWHLAHGVGHGIDPDGLDLGGIFLKLALGGHLRSEGPAGCALP